MSETHADPVELELAGRFRQFLARRRLTLKAVRVGELADADRLPNVPALDDGPYGRCDRVIGREGATLVAEAGSQRNTFRALLRRLTALGCVAPCGGNTL